QAPVNGGEILTLALDGGEEPMELLGEPLAVTLALPGRLLARGLRCHVIGAEPIDLARGVAERPLQIGDPSLLGETGGSQVGEVTLQAKDHLRQGLTLVGRRIGAGRLLSYRPGTRCQTDSSILYSPVSRQLPS